MYTKVLDVLMVASLYICVYIREVPAEVRDTVLASPWGGGGAGGTSILENNF